ncbi:unnamed protein product [Diatraea saccharalis]|uniref:DNA 5'-3' helicase n=1 Tax=Diatraea saccharalis TaxID=40085 RepID=A0A9P0G263_9NEOP|nr:unnamed protein product [Diatraea saccharalis]
MHSSYELSDDDDSFSLPKCPGKPESPLDNNTNTVILSSDEEIENNPAERSYSTNSVICDLTSDEDELPEVIVNSKKGKNSEARTNIIKRLFPVSEKRDKLLTNVSNLMPSSSRTLPKEPGIDKMIGGVSVNMPVEPYGCQIALMSKVITAIKNGKNCLLESPTGSGKTLALLCSALAWQRCERARIGQLLAEQKANNITELRKLHGGVEYVGSVPNVNFDKNVFGQKSIYDSPMKNESCGGKRNEPLQDEHEEANMNDSEKSNDKRRRLNSPKFNELSKSEHCSPQKPTTPQKVIGSPKAETPENVRFLVSLLRTWITDDVNCRTPTIYYGARTHKQLQQVIKEFKRTSYCGEAKMTVLSSRDYSCIREFDKKLWSTKNDMCRGCIKSSSSDKQRGETNCKYYDNRAALNHDSLPPAFDLEDLVLIGKEKKSCPYYAARSMASAAHIVFCPYNYLIEPTIRNSMQIHLQDNILIIDEAHNIEDICRDAASFVFTRDHIISAITELEKVAGYMYSGQEISVQVDFILKTLKIWDDWFANQTPLVANKPLNNNEAVHTWETADFIQTLHNHNLGQTNYFEFKRNAELFCQRLREDPRTLFGVTQNTGTLVESLDNALTYLFGNDGQYMEDFKPALVRTVSTDYVSETVSWRNSQYNQKIKKEILELRLMCMNPGIVFSALKVSKCIVLASGTLTPLSSLYSELNADFPLKVAPNHPIPSDRVWVGTLSTCPDGSRLECKSGSTSQPHVQDALGAAVLRVCRLTPHGVLCFIPSYHLMNRLAARWQETNVWRQLEDLKTIFMESRNVRDHNDVMDDYYKEVETERGAILFAVFRGKVSEGMDFRDHQARAVITIGIPYPNTYDMTVKEKMNYNNRYEKKKNLLSSSEWLRVQAYRALNQAVGRCVRHREDWGAVLMIDARFTNPYYTEHLSKWVRNFLSNNHHTYDSLVNSTNSLESFMKDMTLRENEEFNQV